MLSPSGLSGTIYSSLQAKDFASTTASSISGQANLRLKGKLDSFSSSRNLSPFKGPKGKYNEMMNKAIAAQENATTTRDQNNSMMEMMMGANNSRRAISIQPTRKGHHKQG